MTAGYAACADSDRALSSAPNVPAGFRRAARLMQEDTTKKPGRGSAFVAAEVANHCKSSRRTSTLPNPAAILEK